MNNRWNYPVDIPPPRYVGTGVRPVFSAPIPLTRVRARPRSSMLYELAIALIIGVGAFAAVTLWRAF
jgi:hypothetical protein